MVQGKCTPPTFDLNLSGGVVFSACTIPSTAAANNYPDCLCASGLCVCGPGNPSPPLLLCPPIVSGPPIFCLCIHQ